MTADAEKSRQRGVESFRQVLIGETKNQQTLSRKVIVAIPISLKVRLPHVPGTTVRFNYQAPRRDEGVHTRGLLNKDRVLSLHRRDPRST